MSKKKQYIRIKVFRKPFSYWFPGTDYVASIIHKYHEHMRNGDFLVISEKAIATARGYIYDERLVDVDTLLEVLTKLTNWFWSRICHRFFSRDTIKLLTNTPIDYIARHKKLALRYGGIVHFFKPLSEAGIDATNLPYTYVSLPLSRARREAEYVMRYIYRKIGKILNVMIIDTDKTFRPKKLRGIAFSTRPASVKGEIDLGALAYFLGKYVKKKFVETPTLVAYSGVWIGLPLLLKIAKIADRAMGSGLGANIFEMASRLGRSIVRVGWKDMLKLKHYPAVLARVYTVPGHN